MFREDIIIRNATFNDIDFIAESIMEAEKSGTDIFAYETVFGLSKESSLFYLKQILNEDVDGCELSLSSYLVAEYKGELIAAMGAWIEGETGLSSSTLKGNLLTYTLPKEALLKARGNSNIISELSLDYISNTLCIGVVYVKENSRGKNLVSYLLKEHEERVKFQNIKTCIQVFDNNVRAIKAYEKLGFVNFKFVKSDNRHLKEYLPSDGKILLIKNN